ncbi:hypothetical protein JRQ81_011411 [Phrynocephalus forsythii]|uniref:Uncharacterized protein n=1 Tax=Phrynocephalus forsythii TaxID=171643 RepID=A0A9Q1AQ11_9SAUR|nr:hypothetical protein JRQ81_011411 [Phrynocephalus forsythii]
MQENFFDGQNFRRGHQGECKSITEITAKPMEYLFSTDGEDSVTSKGKCKPEANVFKSREELLIRDNDRIKQKVHQLKELQESLQDDIYVLEEQLCSMWVMKKECQLGDVNPILVAP